MPVSRQSVAQTLNDVVSWRPVLEPVLRAFGPVLEAQAQLVDELAQRMRESGPVLPPCKTGPAGQGVSLLAGAKLAGAAWALRASAERLLPLLEGIEALAPHLPAVAAYFLQPAHGAESENTPEDSRETLVQGQIAGDGKTVARIAEANGLDASVLEFVAGFVAAPVLRAMVAGAVSDDGEGPWNEGEFWQQGYCPVCGAMPSLGWLDKPQVDEKNAFLAGGGGKKHLHCGLCGANWKFRRGACPSCGEEGNGVIEILRESGVSHGERLDWCTRCRTYCPTIDLREREFVPDPDAAAIGMMHLDMVAARKELRPVKPSFWNIY